MVQNIWEFDIFSKKLYEKLSTINAAFATLALYEFRYALKNLTPVNGDWSAVEICNKAKLEELINDRSFYRNNLGGKPLFTFKKHQQKFDSFQGIGYRDFKEANNEID